MSVANALGTSGLTPNIEESRNLPGTGTFAAQKSQPLGARQLTF